ncbi:hypothetical protein [uncultured Rhodoblastus sp.]|uniref:hypothetical protein n=1 Tax=uncultured Rhodoblastus sp. TaxID=543037 RepID=UPI0025FF3883|nr:hypothetical protein [uncultured Rhodoblastus sp.]
MTLDSGAAAKLIAEGRTPANVLSRIETVAPESQFQLVAGIPVARSYRLDQAGDGTRPAGMALISAEARFDGLTLALKADTGKGYPAEIELSPQPGRPLELLDGLPDDLLATLGWDWKVLRKRGTGWTGALRAPRNEPRRSRRIEIALERTVAHLARTLAEPPRQFHDRMVRARWSVVFRRMIPLLLSVVLIAGASAMAFVDIPQEFVMLMMNLPPLMLLMLFGMRELPRFEIPPLPRASQAAAWFPPGERRAGPSQSADLK